LQLASLKIDLKVVEGALHSAQPAAGLAAQVSAPSEVGFLLTDCQIEGSE